MSRAIRGFLLLAAVVVGGSAACSSPSEEADLADRLEAAGLWRDLSAPELETAREEVESGGHPWATPLDENVLFFANGGALADGAAGEFVGELRPALAEVGVDVAVEATSTGDVRIDDEVVEVAGASAVDATMRPLAALNERLAAADAQERFYVLDAGADDATVLLISPDVVEAMQDAGYDAPDETPVEAS